MSILHMRFIGGYGSLYGYNVITQPYQGDNTSGLIAKVSRNFASPLPPTLATALNRLRFSSNFWIEMAR